jgi:hypothetical protein
MGKNMMQFYKTFNLIMNDLRSETRPETVDRVMNEIITGNWKNYRSEIITNEEMSRWLISNDAMVQNYKIDIPERVVNFFIETFALETKRLSDIIDKMKSLNPHLLERQQKQKAKAADRAIVAAGINGGFNRQRNNKRSANKSRKTKSRRH